MKAGYSSSDGSSDGGWSNDGEWKMSRFGKQRQQQTVEEGGLSDNVVKIYRCSKVVRGGRRFSFSALVVMGDRNGRVGVGYGKAKEVPFAVEKGKKIATRALTTVKLVNGTLPHRIMGRYGASKVMLVPASKGTGVIAGASVRAVLELAGVKDVRTSIDQAKNNLELYDRRTILFVDEVHRWNKAQQDALLPHVEKGVIILIGATTENPSFEIISALLSRCRVFVLQALSAEDIVKILKRALKDKKYGLGKYDVVIKPKDFKYLASLSAGDARVALNALEFAVLIKSKGKVTKEITKNDFEQAIQNSNLYYDKAGEEHYNIISALHKSMRGSDADAALYWLGRMLQGGENPLYVARRLIRFASEDIGLANSQALVQAVTAYQACHYVGMPECDLALAQAVVYMAKCKKSNELYRAYGNVKQDVKDTMHLPVPLHIRNAETKLMKDLNYGKGYKYSPEHDYKEVQTYLPEKLKNKKYLDK